MRQKDDPKKQTEVSTRQLLLEESDKDSEDEDEGPVVNKRLFYHHV